MARQFSFERKVHPCDMHLAMDHAHIMIGYCLISLSLRLLVLLLLLKLHLPWKEVWPCGCWQGQLCESICKAAALKVLCQVWLLGLLSAGQVCSGLVLLLVLCVGGCGLRIGLLWSCSFSSFTQIDAAFIVECWHDWDCHWLFVTCPWPQPGVPATMRELRSGNP